MLSATNGIFTGNDGTVLTLTLDIPGYMVFSNPDMVESNPSDTSFRITITEKAGSRILLSENEVEPSRTVFWFDN